MIRDLCKYCDSVVDSMDLENFDGYFAPSANDIANKLSGFDKYLYIPKLFEEQATRIWNNYVNSNIK